MASDINRFWENYLPFRSLDDSLLTSKFKSTHGENGDQNIEEFRADEAARQEEELHTIIGKLETLIATTQDQRALKAAEELIDMAREMEEHVAVLSVTSPQKIGKTVKTVFRALKREVVNFNPKNRIDSFNRGEWKKRLEIITSNNT